MPYLYVILAAVLFGGAPTVQRLVLLTGVTPEALMVISNCVMVVCALLLCAVKHYSLRVTGRQRFQLMLLGVAMASTGLLLNHSYAYIPVGFVTMIHFLYPTVVCVAMALLFRQRLTPLKCAAIAVSLGGLALLGGGGAMGEGGGLGILLAALSSLTYAAYVIFSDKGAVGGLPLLVRLAYAAGTSMVVCLCAALLSDGVFPADGQTWLLGACAGLLLGSGYFFLSCGIKGLGATTAAFINMLEPVTSLALSALVYRYAIAPRSAWGSALLLGSVLLIALDGRRRAK